MTKEEIRGKARAAKNKMSALLSKAEAEKRGFTKEEDAEFKGLTVELDGYLDLLENMKTDERIDKKWSTPVNDDIPTDLYNSTSSIRRRTSGGPGHTYRELFGTNVSNEGFEDHADFLDAVHSGLVDTRLRPMNSAASTGVGEEGGFAVPSQMAQVVLDGSLESEIVRPRATVWAMTSKERIVPSFDGLDSSTSLYGFTASWMSELGEGTPQAPKLRAITLNAKKLALFCQASSEILADGLGFADALQSAMIAATSWSLDNAFLNGNGVGQPIGVLNSGALITVDKETLQKAGTLCYENIINMMARMLPGSLNNCVWVASETCMPALMTLSFPVGTGGVPVPILQKSSVGSQWTLQGIPVVFSEKLPTIGNKGDILLADFSHYCIGMRQEISIAKSNAPGFLTDSEYYRIIVRVDGMPMFDKPIKRKNANTVSPFVVCADRK